MWKGLFPFPFLFVRGITGKWGDVATVRCVMGETGNFVALISEDK